MTFKTAHNGTYALVVGVHNAGYGRVLIVTYRSGQLHALVVKLGEEAVSFSVGGTGYIGGAL